MLKNLTQNNKTSKYNTLIHDENQYLNLISDIIDEGTMINSRNGNALTVYGSVMHFDLTNNKIPILTTKKTAWKTCLKELFWFIKGSTNNQELKDQNVKIWDGNSSREYLDSINLNHYEENDSGNVNHLILPGVGAFHEAMKILKRKKAAADCSNSYTFLLTLWCVLIIPLPLIVNHFNKHRSVSINSAALKTFP